MHVTRGKAAMFYRNVSLKREQSEEIGLTKIYAGSNGRTRHPRRKVRRAACFIFRGWIARSSAPSFLDGSF